MGGWDIVRRPAVRVGVGVTALLATFATLTSDEKSAARSSLGVAPSPTTTRGDMIRRGAAADERVALGAPGSVWTAGATDPGWSAPSVTAAQISDSTSTGRSLLTAASPASALGVLYPYPVTLLTGLEGEWTATGTAPTGATASITGGQVTLTIPTGVSCDFTLSPCATGAIRAVRSIPAPLAQNYSLRIRVVSVTNSAAFVPMTGVVTTEAESHWTTADAKYAVYFAGNSDTAVFARIASSGGTIGSAAVTGIRGGQGWIRLDVQGRSITAYGGIGAAGAEPTTWTILSSVAMTSTDRQPQRVLLAAHASSSGSPMTVVWDSVRLQGVQ